MNYTELNVWRKSMGFVTTVYEATNKFPNHEKFALSSQIRKAAVSIPSNIAEGHGRRKVPVYLNHLSIAISSLVEVETQLRIACCLGYLATESLTKLLSQSTEIGKMLNGLIASLKRFV